MSTVLVNQIRSRIEKPSQNQDGNDTELKPNLPAKKAQLQRTKSPNYQKSSTPPQKSPTPPQKLTAPLQKSATPSQKSLNPPKPVPYREHISKKKDDGEEWSTAQQEVEPEPVGYATVLIHKPVAKTTSTPAPKVPVAKLKPKDGRVVKDYETPMPNTVNIRREYEKGGGDKKPIAQSTRPTAQSPSENEKPHQTDSKPPRPAPPQQLLKASPDQLSTPKHHGNSSPPPAQDSSASGIRSLISRFNDSKTTTTTTTTPDSETEVSTASIVPSKPVHTGRNGRKTSAPDLFQMTRDPAPCPAPITEEDKYYIYMRDEGKSRLVNSSHFGASTDSGFSDAIEGSLPLLETPPPQLGEQVTGASPSQRYANESEEDRLRRSVRRRGLHSDGFLATRHDSTEEPVTNLNKTKTLDSLASDGSEGYLRVLPGQHIPPPKPPPPIRTGEFESLMKAAGLKESKGVRKPKNHFRKLSDPAIKALKVALDAEASRRSIDEDDLKQKKGGAAKRPDSEEIPTSPPKEKTKLFSKLTRAVRGNKKEEPHSSSSVAKEVKKSQSFNVAKTNRVTALDNLPVLQEEGLTTPPGSDLHTQMWEDRMDLHLRPPAPLPRFHGDMHAYAKMPFRRNQRVSVKIAGLRPLRHTTSVPIGTNADPPLRPPLPTDTLELPPPLYPKSRSIKRSILINQGFNVEEVRDWSKSINDLMQQRRRWGHRATPPGKHTTHEPYDDICLGVGGRPPLWGMQGESSGLEGDSPCKVRIPRSSSLSDLESGVEPAGREDPYYLLVNKPSMLQHMLSTSVEVLFRTSSSGQGAGSGTTETRERSRTMPSALPLAPKYENFDDLSNYVMLESSGQRAGGQRGTSPLREPTDDYIKMSRSMENERHMTVTCSDKDKEGRYMNLLDAESLLNEGEELEIPDYIKMSGIGSASPFTQQLSVEGYIHCRPDLTQSFDEYMTFSRGRGQGDESELTHSAPVTSSSLETVTRGSPPIAKGSYMNWVDLPEEFNSTLTRKDGTGSESGTEKGTEVKPSRSGSSSPPVPPKSHYAFLPPEDGTGEVVIEDTDAVEEGSVRRDSFIVKTEEFGQDGRYMNFEMAEQSLSSYPATRRPPMTEKLPMPSPRKASLSRRRPLNSLHPNIHFEDLPNELKHSLNNQWSRKSVVSMTSDAGEDPSSSSGTLTTKSLGGYCVVCSACEEFTHVGGVLKPRDECGLYVEVPSGAIKKGRAQKLWFVVCYDSQYPGSSWQQSGTLSRNSSDEGQLLEEDSSERSSRTSTVSPLVFLGPSTAELLKPLKVHLPHCASFQDSSLRCWLEAKCYEMPRWATVCQRPFYHTPPQDKTYLGQAKQSYKPQIVFQLLPTSAIIRTSHLGGFCLKAAAYRGTVKAAKRMFAAIFQRVPGNESSSALCPIVEDEEVCGVKSRKDRLPSKTELLVVISNDLPYVAEVIQWILERGSNKYACLERYLPFRYCANGRDCELILHGDSSITPIQTTSVPFGNLWRMKRIGEGWQVLTVRRTDKLRDQVLTFSIKQGGFPKQYTRNIGMHDY